MYSGSADGISWIDFEKTTAGGPEPMPQRVLVKLREGVPLSLASPRIQLRPLFDEPAQPGVFGLTEQSPWYLADVPDDVSPWDSVHSQVLTALGLDGSAILFAEPDLKQEPLA